MTIICNSYVRYVLKHYGEGTIILFNRYDCTLTKYTMPCCSKGKVGKAEFLGKYDAHDKRWFLPK